jgi:hypothetical protein
VGLYGYDAEPLAEHWNGTSWTLDSMPLPPSSGQPLASTGDTTGVSCTAATACTAVGNWEPNAGESQPLAERWDGSSWTPQTAADPSSSNANAGASLGEVSCTSATACNAVGGQSPDGTGGQTLAEHWNGTKWTIVATPNLSSTDDALNGIVCASATACELIGNYEDSSQSFWGFAGTSS